MWRADAIDFRLQAARRFVPSIRPKFDVPQLYRQALRALPEAIDGELPSQLPTACPVTLDELLTVPE